jgi:hypothetical protein
VSLWSVSPGQGEPLLDQNLPEIPVTAIDPRQGGPVAILPMAHNFERSGAGEGGQSLIGLEAYHQLASQRT